MAMICVRYPPGTDFAKLMLPSSLRWSSLTENGTSCTCWKPSLHTLLTLWMSTWTLRALPYSASAVPGCCSSCSGACCFRSRRLTRPRDTVGQPSSKFEEYFFLGKFPQLFYLQRRHVVHTNFGTWRLANSIS